MHLNNIQRLAVCISAIAIFIGLMHLSLNLSPQVSYSDFIAGYVAWTNTTKFQDLVVMPVAVTGTILFIIFMIVFFEKIDNLTIENNSKDAPLHVIYWTIPAIAAISTAILYNKFDSVFFCVSLIGILSLASICFITIKRNHTVDVEAISIGLMCIFFLTLIPLNLAMPIKFFPTIIQGGDSISGKAIGRVCVAFLFLSLLSYLFLVYKKEELPYRLLSVMALLSQLSLPLLYLSLYPAKLLDPNGSITRYDTGIGLRLIIVGLILAAVIDVVYRYYKYRALQTLPVKLLSPFAICALLVTLKAGITAVPTLSADDYHFGEDLLGWWVYLQGYIPYIDYTPAHGIIQNDLAGLLNVFLYDGTAASLAEAQRFTLCLLSIIAFLAVYFFTGSILWAFVSIYFLGARLAWLFFIPFVALWLNRSLIENKIRWSAVWFITAPIVILGVPPQGLLLVVASGAVPIYFLWQTISNKDWVVIKPITLFAAAIFLFYAITPLGSMFVHAINYVLINGSINQAAYGVPWSSSFGSPNLISEAVRMSWIVVPFLCFLSLYFLYKKKSFYAHLTLPLFVIAIFSFLLIPYSMGRIDPGGVSRPGLVGILLIAGLMGFAFWYLLDRYSRVWLFLGVVFLSSSLKFADVSHQALLNASASFKQIGHVIDTSNTDLKNIGAASMIGSHWSRINDLNDLLNRKLQPEESYLDLTSRNAQYFYLNRKPVIPVTAPYNMISYKQQVDAVSLLKNNLPRIALLEGENITQDGGGLAIRNYHLYRFLLEQYEPFEDNGFIIGLSKESINRGDWGDVPMLSSIEKMVLFEKSFSGVKKNLEKLPVSWGGSINTLEKNMTIVADLTSVVPSLHDLTSSDVGTFTVTGGDPYTVYDLSGFSLSGKSAGFLKLDFECISKQRPPGLQVFWWGDEQSGGFEESSLLLSASNGTLLIPLDTSPRWMLLRQIMGLRIDLIDPASCGSYKIMNLSLHQRKLVDL